MEDVRTFMLLEGEPCLKVLPLDWIIFSEIPGYLKDEDNENVYFSILSTAQRTKTTRTEENIKEINRLIKGIICRSWIFPFCWHSACLIFKPIYEGFLPKSNLRMTLGSYRSHWGPQKSKNKLIAAFWSQLFQMEDTVVMSVPCTFL